MGKKKITAYIILVGAMVLWSFSYIWLKVVYNYLTPLSTTFFRLIIASLFFIVVSLVLGKLQRIQKKDILLFLGLSLFEPFLYYLFESYGVSLVSPGVAAIIISTIPLFLPFSMYFLLKEPISSGNLWGMFISFIGVMMVVLTGNFTFAASPVGIALLAGAVASVLGYSFLLQNLVKRYNAFTIIVTQNFIGMLYFIPLFLIFDLSKMSTLVITGELVWTLIALAVFASALAFFLFTLGMQRIGIVKATMFTYVIPLFTSIISFFFLHEEFTAQKVLGMLIVISGLLLSQIGYKKVFQKPLPKR